MHTLQSLEEVNADCVTLTRFIISQQIKHNGTGQFSQLMSAIQTACKAISSAVRRAGIANLYGLQGSANTSGDKQQKLDVICNDLFINTLYNSHAVCCMISEENEKPILVEKSKRGKYMVTFDPLDGSSNIDCLASIGSIFAIYEGIENFEDTDSVENGIYRSGRSILAGGYTLYGSATMLVLALKDYGVSSFTLDPSIGEFILTEENIKMCEKGKIYSINEGYESGFDTYLKEYIKSLKYPNSGSSYGARYVGSMVSDVHRTLKYGGIFMYPATKHALNGKLRILYEAFPMSLVIELAGGKSTDGNKDVLDIFPESLHSPTPIFMGSKLDVETLLEYKKRYSY